MASYGPKNSHLFKNDRFLPPLDPKDDVFTFNPPDSDIKEKENPKKHKQGPVKKMTADKKKTALRDTTKGRKNRCILPTDSELDEYGSDTSSMVGHKISMNDGYPSSSKRLSSSSSSSSSSQAHGGGYAAPTGMTFKPLVSAVDEATDDDEAGGGSPKRTAKRPRKTIEKAKAEEVVQEKVAEEVVTEEQDDDEDEEEAQDDQENEAENEEEEEEEEENGEEADEEG